MRLQSSIANQKVYVNVPDGSFAGNICPAGYNFAKIWDEQGRYQVDVCIPAPVQSAPPPPPPAPVYNNINTVNPNINVSPQISPVLQQQFQPNNSPATAGTTQTRDNTAPPAYVAPPPERVTLPPPPAVVPDYTTPSVQTNMPPPPALPPATGSANIAYEAAPPLTSLLNNPNIAKNAPADLNSSAPVTNTGNSKVMLIGLGALALLALLFGSKKRK